MAHIHEVIDSDKCFTIDPITRAIVNDAGNKKTQLIQNDHNSERFAFQLPRYIEGHDMSLSNKVEVHYINLDQTSNERSVGVYEVTDLALSEDNESVLLSWLISNNATKYVGVLSFAICFKCMSDDVIDYSWNTAINSSIQIAKGMYNSEIIIKDYIDVLEAWKEEFMNSIGPSEGCLRAIDPIGTGSFSMNRFEGSTVGENSVTFGSNNIASGYNSFASGISNIAGYYNRYNVTTTKRTTDDVSTIKELIIDNLKTIPDDISINRDVIVLGINTQTNELLMLKTTIKTIEQGTDSETGALVLSLTIDETKITDIDNTVYVSLYTELVDTNTENGPFSAASYTYVEGGFNVASGIASHAEGYGTTASGEYSHAEGQSTTVSGDSSHAEGRGTMASGIASHAEGESAKVSSDYSHAEGYHTTASGYISHAEGYYTEAKGQNSHAEGDHTTASGYNTHAEGDHTTASGYNTHAEGDHTTASGADSHAEGYNTKASGDSSHAEGYCTEAKGQNSHAEGYYNLSGGYTKFDASLGSETVGSTINYYIDVANLDATLISTNDEIYVLVKDNASTENQICKITASSITEYNTTDEVSTVKHKIYFDENELRDQMSGFPNIEVINIYVKNSNDTYSTHAEGYLTVANGNYGSHAEGIHTMASGDYGSHAEGEYATASGPVSHAEGYYTTASGDSSHAEGDHTTASGENSHAEGFKTTASGVNSHAEGEYTKASGKYAHVEGYHTTARSNSQHVQGKYNVEDTNGTYAHIVGGGTSNTNKKNIHTLDWNGNAVYSGDVKATDSEGNQVSLLDTKWKLQGNVTSNNTIALPNNFTELKVMTFKTNDDYPIAYTQTITKDMIDVINKNTVHLYCGNTQQYGASWSINTSAKTIQLANIENTTPVDNYATYLYYR